MINRHHFQGFDFAEEQNMAFKMSSFAETMALGYLKSQVHKYKSAQIHKYKEESRQESWLSQVSGNGISLFRMKT